LARRFEDLRAWQAARDLTSAVYMLARHGQFARDFALSDQIRRAAISTMNNIAEGFDSASRAEFGRFLRYAARSASEVQSCLHVAVHQRYIGTGEFDRVYLQCASVRRLCVALIGSLEGRRAANRDPEVHEPPSPAYGRAVPRLAGSLACVSGDR
jgi:four helix bundle protein